ncbi:hypothetical protein PSN45_002460 [Yamadazyma tenuis]|uniref:uncharacterized protein n=1 Tax=Candida tenuis TaxID=2315449 RepID=UPI0027A53952|nr:hypothetical protein PSN45_002460 [Yamadazyma tenuis]
MIGTACLVNKDLTKQTPKRSQVIYISFSNLLEFYTKACKKNGVDLSRESNFHFIDCFTDLFTKHITNPENASSQTSKLFSFIIKQLSMVPGVNKIVFIENPEILLTATSISSVELSNSLVKLNRLCRNLFVISCHTSPQIVDIHSKEAYDPNFKTSDFLVKLHQRAHLNIYLEPLTTGRAKDITGILTVSKGPLPFESSIIIDEKSYTYNVTKESNIKLYFR